MLMLPTDSLFLIAESREQPMHVGSLQVYDLPDGVNPTELLSAAYDELLQATDVAPLFRRRAHRSLASLGQWSWVEDDDVDLEHHVRHSALPRPGRVRELLALVSRLHSTPLDRTRPLWEMHLIEGLEGQRFAVYVKVHHALVDGVSGIRMISRTLSREPDGQGLPAFWTRRPPASAPTEEAGLLGAAKGVLGLPKAALDVGLGMAGLLPRLVSLAEQGLRHQAAVLPGQAPRTMLNVPITGSRRYAAQTYSLERMRMVAKANGVTLNDVLLAMSSAALRTYLIDNDALPDSPLIAMTPVSLRKDEDDEASGNAVGAILANLATDLADPAERLHAIAESTTKAKASLAGLSQLQVLALSTGVMLPMAANTLPGLSRVTPLPFNVVISNVPGPRESLYLHGARLSGLYPMSIPINGQGMNITATSYAGDMGIGLTGCRRTVPHLQRMLGGLEAALDELVELG